MHIPRIVAREHFSSDIPFNDIIFKKTDLIGSNARISRFDIRDHVRAAEPSLRDGKRGKDQLHQRLFGDLFSGRKKIRDFVFAEDRIQHTFVRDGISDDHSDFPVAYAPSNRATDILRNCLRLKKGIGSTHDADTVSLDRGSLRVTSAPVDILGKKAERFTLIPERLPENGLLDSKRACRLCRSAKPSFRFRKDGNRGLISVFFYKREGHRHIVRMTENIFQHIVLLHGKRRKRVDENVRSLKEIVLLQQRIGARKHTVGVFKSRGDLLIEDREDQSQIRRFCAERRRFTERSTHVHQIRRRDLIVIAGGAKLRHFLKNAEMIRFSVFLQRGRKRFHDVPHDQLLRASADIIHAKTAEAAKNVVAKTPERQNVDILRVCKFCRAAFRSNSFSVGNKQVYLFPARNPFHFRKYEGRFTRARFSVNKAYQVSSSFSLSYRKFRIITGYKYIFTVFSG